MGSLSHLSCCVRERTGKSQLNLSKSLSAVKTTTPSVKRASIAKSTWSCMPATRTNQWHSSLIGMMWLYLEKSVNQSLLDLHKVATSHDDPQMCDSLETEYLEEQVKSIKEIGDHITQLKRVGSGLGEYLYDKENLGE